MAAKSPFPLLNLPLVPLDEVMKSMTFQELMPLSLTSNKIRKVIKSYTIHKSYKLDINIGSHSLLDNGFFYMDLWCTNGEKLRYTIELEDDHSDSQISLSKVDDIFMTINTDPEELVASFWKDRTERFELLLHSFHKAFNPEIKLALNSRNESKASRVLDVIKKVGITLNDAALHCSPPSNNIFQKFLNVSSKKLRLGNFLRNNNFQYAPSNAPMKFDFISIKDARWAKLEYFLYCKRIELQITELKVVDLIEFLKHWKELDCPLEFFKVHIRWTDTFNSIGTELSLAPIKKINTRYDGHKVFKDGRCFGIQRPDGKKSVIYLIKCNAYLETVPC